MTRSRPGLWLLCLLLAAGACVPAPTEQHFPRRFAQETLMGEIQAAGRIDIGIPSRAAPLAYRRGGRLRGMAIDLGRAVARTLRVRAHFMQADSERLLELTADGDLEMSFPALAATESRLRAQPYANPYVVAHQRLLVHRSARIDGVEDLTTKRVCSFIDPAVGVDVGKLAPGASVVRETHLERCMNLFARGAVDAVTAEDIYLGYMLTLLDRRDRPARIVGDSLTTEGYGPAVMPGATGFTDFLDTLLNAMKEDGRWADAYERAVGVAPSAPPELTIQEAAALFPS
jgi:ABC-type amino acid transport substrate-binding protein